MLKDLDVKDVIDHLISEEVIDEDDYERITSARTRRDRVITLLDLLPTRGGGSRSFPALLAALRPRFHWLADELEQHVQQLSSAAASPSDASAREQLLEEVLRAGAVPSLPKFSIERAEQVAVVRRSLAACERDHMVMVHGMAGVGKSVCVNQALRDPNLVLDHFPGGVFWLTIGQLDHDMLIGRIQTLCVRLAAADSTDPAAVASSSAQLPATAELAAERLRRLLLMHDRQRALVVLDDVWNSDVVSVFDMGAPLLLVTRDQAVVDKVQDRVHKVEFQDGFSWTESSELFARRLGVPSDMLPSEAEDIHRRCRGSPMVISLLCAYLSEKRASRDSRNRWQYCLNNMKDANYQKLKKKHSYEFANVMDAIGISVKSLDSDVYSSFEDLVVFQADVSIPCQVLCTYWSIELEEVENRMSELVKKALVQEHWDNERDTMVYGVHDLIVDYMELNISPTRKSELHARLLERYLAQCGDDYGRLQDDYYMLWYIGHHVFHAGRHQLFAQLYFSLPFIGAKLRATGTSDLLSDFRKYAEFIDMGAGNDARRRDYENFVRTAGHRAQVAPSDPFIDPSGAIIQLALCQPDESSVYQSALQEAEKRAAQHLFLRWSNKESMRWSNVICTKVFSSGVCHVAFTDEADLALTAYGDGNIKLWNVVTGDEHPSFRGHRDRVNQLCVSRDGSRFVSASDDQLLKVWDLAGAVQRAHESTAVRTPSPKLRQSSGLFGYTALGASDHSLVTLKGHEAGVLCADWSPDGSRVVSGGVDRSLRVWDMLGELLFNITDAHDDVITCCVFSLGGGGSDGCGGVTGQEIIASGSADGRVKLWSTDCGQLKFVFDRHRLRVVGLCMSAHSSYIVSVAEKEMYRWNWEAAMSTPMLPTTGTPSSTTLSARSGSVVARVECESVQIRAPQDCELYLCACMGGDGLKLVTGTSNNMYETWDLLEKRIVALQRGFTGSVTSVAFSRCSERLLAAAGDTVSACSLGDTPRVEDSLLPLFSAVFSTDSPDSLMIAAITSNSGVQVLKGLGGNVLGTTNSVGERICLVELNATGDMVAFGCEDGSVGVYRIEQLGITEPRVLGRHSQRVISLQFGAEGTVVSGAEDNTMKIWWPDGTCTTCGGNGGAVTQVGLFEWQNKCVAVSCSRDGTLKVFLVSVGAPARLISAHRAHSGATVTCYRIIRSRLDKITSPPHSPHTAAIAAKAATTVKFSTPPPTVNHNSDTNNNNNNNNSSSSESNGVDSLPPPRPTSPCPPDLMVVTAAVDGSVKICRLVDGLEVKAFWLDHGPVRTFQLSHDLSLLVTGHDDGHVVVTRTDAEGTPLVLNHHQSWVNDLKISPDCSYIISLGDSLAWWKLYIEDMSSAGRLRLKSLVAPSAPGASRLRVPRRQFIKYRPPLSAGGVRGARPAIRARLLQTFAFRGSGARRLLVDPRWTHAVTIDDAGVLHVLQVM